MNGVIELDGFPIVASGVEKYAMSDLRIRDGDLSIVNGDFEMVSGIAGLAQIIEFSLSTGSERLTLKTVAPRLSALALSESGRYFEEFLAARHIGQDDIEVEFRAAGYPGSYLHRIRLQGLAGSYDVVAVPKATIFAVDRINDALLAELAKRPDGLDKLHHREFEHVIARLVERMGYEVELTKATGDGGVDIFAIQREGLSPCMTVIDCKKYKRDRRIGPEIVRTIAGVRQQHGANTGMIVTTAYFTDGARNLQRDTWPHEIALADRDRVLELLKSYGWEKQSDIWMPR